MLQLVACMEEFSSMKYSMSILLQPLLPGLGSDLINIPNRWISDGITEIPVFFNICIMVANGNITNKVSIPMQGFMQDSHLGGET